MRGATVWLMSVWSRRGEVDVASSVTFGVQLPRRTSLPLSTADWKAGASNGSVTWETLNEQFTNPAEGADPPASPGALPAGRGARVPEIDAQRWRVVVPKVLASSSRAQLQCGGGPRSTASAAADGEQAAAPHLGILLPRGAMLLTKQR